MISLNRALDAVNRFEAENTGGASLIAPAGTRDQPLAWEGRCSPRAWEYRITAAIPHLNTPEPLEVLVELLRRQSPRPYILIVDTGSDKEVCDRLEDLRAPDLEIHYLRSHGWLHPSAPITAAMDVAFALCQTRWLFATHSDVFPRRRDLLARLLKAAECFPVVGYQMSPRPGTDKWKNVVSHTCTLFDMHVMREHRVGWNLLRYFERGFDPQEAPGWPDTESGLDHSLKESGIPVKFIGRDQNLIRQADDLIDHSRSYTGSKLYCAGAEQEENAARQLAQAIADARRRLSEWRRADGV